MWLNLRKVIILREQGLSFDSIARELGVARETVRRAYRNWEQEQQVQVTETVEEEVTTSPENLVKYVAFSNQLIVICNDVAYTVTDSDSRYPELLEACINNDEKTVAKLLLPKVLFSSHGIELSADGVCKVHGLQVSSVLTDYIVKVSAKPSSENYLNLIAFIERLYNFNMLDKLDMIFSFLKHNDIQLIEGGLILGYKYIRKVPNFSGFEYVDAHSRTLPQGIGYEVTIDKVDDNPDRTCSYGLHVGSFDYIKNTNLDYAIVLVKPENIVSIPTDYDGMKMRCKSYFISEIKSPEDLEVFKGVPNRKFKGIIDTINETKEYTITTFSKEGSNKVYE